MSKIDHIPSPAPVPPASKAPRRRAAGADPSKRQQILRGAWDTVMALGFDGATMAAISRTAGVSKGTLYVYFRDQEDLFVALIEEMRNHQLQRFTQTMQQAEPIEARLTHLGQSIIDVMTSAEMLRLQRRVIAVAERMPELSLRFYEAGTRQIVASFANCLQLASERGDLQITDTAAAAQQFIDLACGGLWRRKLFGSLTTVPSPEERTKQVDGAVRLFLAAYTPARDIPKPSPPCVA